jgi:hypothetical protein
MKLLMIIVDAGRGHDVEAILDCEHVDGYTELPAVLGRGEHGRKEGTRAFPGTSAMYLAAIPPEKVDAIADDLRALRDAHPEHGLHAYGFDMTPLL